VGWVKEKTADPAGIGSPYHRLRSPTSAPRRAPPRPYNRRDADDNTPFQVASDEFELPAERLTRSLDDARSPPFATAPHLGIPARQGAAGRRERVVGAPTVMEEAVDLLVENAVREAVREQEIVPLASPEVEVTQAEEGKPVIFKATLQSGRRSSSATSRTSVQAESRPSTRRWSRRWWTNCATARPPGAGGRPRRRER